MAKALSEYSFPATTGDHNALNSFVGKFAPAAIKVEAQEKLREVQFFFEDVAALDVLEFKKFQGQRFPRQVFDSTLNQFPSLSLHPKEISYDQITGACQGRLEEDEKKSCLASASLDFFIETKVSPKSREDSISYRDTELFLESSDLFPVNFSEPLQESLKQFLLALQSILKKNFDKS